MYTYQPNDSSLMMSTTRLNFTDTRKSGGLPAAPRPTSIERRNKPHSELAFRTVQLPTGGLINVSTLAPVTEPKPDPFQGRRFKCSASIQQKDFNTPALEPWQRGNTKRYGCNSQPWSRKAYAAVGIVPAVPETSLNELSVTQTTNSEAFQKFTRYGAGLNKSFPGVRVTKDLGEQIQQVAANRFHPTKVVTPQYVSAWVGPS